MVANKSFECLGYSVKFLELGSWVKLPGFGASSTVSSQRAWVRLSISKPPFPMGRGAESTAFPGDISSVNKDPLFSSIRRTENAH